ncbi:MAG: M1 family metallopeptidase [Candidatus Kryptoniota bacterium]
MKILNQAAVYLMLVASSSIAGGKYWQQYVHYNINATLIDSSHTIIGTETIYYKNNSGDSLKKIYVRLYWNLFKKGSYGYNQAIRQKRYDILTTGDMTMKECALVLGESRLPLDFKVNNTLAEVFLSRPLPPDSAFTFYISWISKVPNGGDRAGYIGEDYDVAQWYPQIAVYDRYGWDTDQYLDRGEFYDDYGTFDVSITLPKKFLVAATGELINAGEVLPDSVIKRLEETRNCDSTCRIVDYSSRILTAEDERMTTWKFHADSVRDFAWAADPFFIWDVSYWNGIAVHALYFADKAMYWKDAARMGRHAISFFSQHFGMYAYKQAFVVEGTEGGGMEYPGIVFIGHIGDPNNHRLAQVIMHELGHQWYPMMIGSNETEYGFQDEGFNTFITTLALESFYGRYNNSFTWTEWYQRLLDFPNTNERERNLSSYLFLAYSGYEEPVLTHPDHYAEPSLQDISIYNKTSDVMFMLRYVLGDSVFSKLMLEYYNRYKFKHVYPEDFFNLAQEVSGNKNLRWFFDEWFNRTYTCDYGISRLSSRALQTDSGKVFINKISISRCGQIVMPVDLHLYLEDKSESVFDIPVSDWQDGELKRTYELITKARTCRAALNPGGEIADIDRLNNTWPHPELKIRFDNTMVNFYPSNAYLVTWRPSLWYNSVDGLKFGLRLSGSYLGYLKAFDAGLWYGTHKSSEFNYDLQLHTLVPGISRQMTVYARLSRLDGVEFYSAGFSKLFASHLSYPPYHTINISVSSMDARQSDYFAYPSLWLLNVRVNFIRAEYEYQNYWKNLRVNFKAGYEADLPIFKASAVDYSVRSLEFKGTYSFLGNFIGLRLYDGRASGTLPPQFAFYLAGANPAETWNYPIIRSRGTLSRQMLENARVPGGGFVRSMDANLHGSGIDALNMELHFGNLIPFVSPYSIPFLGYPLSLFASKIFYDGAFLGSSGFHFIDSNHFYQDAGVGLTFDVQKLWRDLFRYSTRIFQTDGIYELNIDFPIYANRPEYAGGTRMLEFRWRLSFETSF